MRLGQGRLQSTRLAMRASAAPHELLASMRRLPSAPARRLLLALPLLILAPACGLSDDGSSQPGEGRLGDVAWSYPSNAPFGQNDVRPVINGTVAGSGVAYIAHARQLDAVALAGGERLWSSPVPTANPYGYPIVSAALLDAGDRLVLNDHDAVHAYAKTNGRRLWSTRVPGYAGLEFITMGQDDAHVYLPGAGEIVQIAIADGAITRRLALPPGPDGGVRTARNPLVYRGVIYVPDVRGTIEVAYYGDVVALDLATGAVLWDQELPLYYRPDTATPTPGDSVRDQTSAYGVAAAGDLVVVATEVALHGLDARTGAILWSAPHIDESGFSRSPVVADGAVYMGGTTQWLYKHDAQTGVELWRYRVRGSFSPVPAVDGGRVYVTDQAYGEVHVVDAATGARVWDGPPPNGYRSGEGYASPVAVGGGRIVVASDRAVYGLVAPTSR